MISWVALTRGSLRSRTMALDDLMARELERFRPEHPRSEQLAGQAQRSLLGGVPMHWMVRWPGGFPVFAAEAEGARFRDVDGHEYVDFCLGDTGAMTGHAPPAAVSALADQAARGITLMLPSEDALWVGEEMGRRFGLPTATSPACSRSPRSPTSASCSPSRATTTRCGRPPAPPGRCSSST